MAPVAKRFTISFSLSTSSRGTAGPATPGLNWSRPRRVASRVATSFVYFEKRQ